MKNVLKALVLVPVGLIILVFAIANRHNVAVSLDPFATMESSALTATAPLFVFLLLALIIGVMIGGASTWITQGRHRKAARQARSEIERLRADAASFKARVGEAVGSVPALPPPASRD